MTEELKHSELPWVYNGKREIFSAVDSEYSVAVVHSTKESGFNVDAMHTNAKLIVESVNNAARYKEALERITLVDVNKPDDYMGDGGVLSRVKEAARNALNIKED